MRYFELLETISAPMKTKDVNKANFNRTIGFEFEIAYSLDEDTENMLEDEDALTDKMVEEVAREYSIDTYINDNISFIEFIEEADTDIDSERYSYMTEKQVQEYKEKNNPEKFEKTRNLKEVFDNLDFEEATKDDLIHILYKAWNLYRVDIKSDKPDPDKYEQLMSEDKDELLKRIIKAYEHVPKLPEEASDNKKNNSLLIDNEGNIIDLRKQMYFNDFINLFEDPETVRDEIVHEYDEHIHELAIEKAQDELRNYTNNAIDNIHKYILKYIDSSAEKSYNYHSFVENKNSWKVEYDSTISPIGAEVISSVFSNLDEGISSLSNVLQLIRSKEELETNNSTGLHINIGDINTKNIDLLKLILFSNERKVINDFERSMNNHTKSNINKLYDLIKNHNTSDKSYDELINSLNVKIRNNMSNDRDMYFNFKKLFEKGILEIRGMGGKNYESKENDIKWYIKQAYRMLDIASDPNAYVETYAKKLSKFVQEDHIKQKNDDIEATNPLNKNEAEKLYKFLHKNLENLSIIQLKTKAQSDNKLIVKLINDSKSFMIFLRRLPDEHTNFPTDILRIILKIFKHHTKNNNFNSYKEVKRLSDNLPYGNLRDSVKKYILPMYDEYKNDNEV